MTTTRIGLIIVAVLLCIGIGFGLHYGIAQHRAAKMTEQFNTLTAEREKLIRENAQLAGEIAEIKTQREAQENIIAAKGGDIAVQQQKIEDAQKAFDAEEAANSVPTEAKVRCERLRQKYIDLKVRGADKIDCSKL